MTQVVRLLRNGQITIPVTFREKLGIGSDSLLKLTFERGGLCIKPVKVIGDKVVDSAWLEGLYEHFSKVREEAKNYSEKEIDRFIDRAVKNTRSSHD